jgi:hypothetical protein
LKGRSGFSFINMNQPWGFMGIFGIQVSGSDFSDILSNTFYKAPSF